MAIGKGGKVKERQSQSSTSGYLSDDSDFYGDQSITLELEERAESFSITDYWENRVPSVTEIALAHMAMSRPCEALTGYNPYEGMLCACQLSESVEQFLARLPPATTLRSDQVPWIYIANPYRKAARSQLNSTFLAEGPAEEESDWPRFVRAGAELLEQLTADRHDLEKANPGLGKGQITRLVNQKKEVCVRSLLDGAVQLHCTTGKWMIFPQNEHVNSAWSVVARATANNELGIAAKVAPFSGQARQAHLICIYTKDFSDMDDISRVLLKLKNLGMVEAAGRAIYYKCDAYTHLNIMSDNQWGIQASLYKSSDIFSTHSGIENTKLDAFCPKQQGR